MKLFSLSILLLLTLGASQTGDISPSSCLGYDKDIATYAVQYAFCSNVAPKDDAYWKIGNWTYKPCTQAQTADKVTDIELIPEKTLNLLALVVYDIQRNLIVISFRGTVCGNSNIDGIIDFDLTPVVYINSEIGGGCKILSGCMAHQGFMVGYNSLKGRVREAASGLAKKYMANHPTVLVTGISLGGALAAHASYDLSVYFKHLGLKVPFLHYTFGQPRIGNKRFIDEINKEIHLIRVVNKASPVPHLPPRALSCIQSHIKHQIYYNPGVQIFFDSSDPEACNGDTSSCSLNKLKEFDVCDHLAYPKLDYLGSRTCNVKVPNPSLQIQDSIAQKECHEDIKFICQFLCSGQHKPDCFKHMPDEMKCDNRSQTIQSYYNSLLMIMSGPSDSTKATDINGINICKKLKCSKQGVAQTDQDEL